MKKVVYVICLAFIGLSFACEDNGGLFRERVVYDINEPVLMSAKDFRSKTFEVMPSQEIKQQGKICFYEGYLYISEPGKGIHIIDNRQPSAPRQVGFMELEENADIAVRNNKLYADAYIDLLWFDISNPEKPEYEGRLENAFKYAVPAPENEWICDMSPYYSTDNPDKVIVGWKPGKREYYYEYHKGEDMYMEAAPGASANGGGSNGVNGSMSRFSLYKDYLYSVINNTMIVIDLSEGKAEKAAEDIYVGMDVETIFNYKDYMYLGTPTGMSIYSVENPLKPERMSTVWHVFGCDPVVVEDDIAYVTIHSGNNCGQNNNELLIIDVTDVKSPQHIVSYSMTKPQGLGIDNGTLFVCDDGLKVFDASDPQTLMAKKLAHYSGMEGYDLIPYNNVLMMIANDGLYQYDYKNVEEISLLSKISIGK